MKSALIGHTGFVGGVLKAAGGYTDFYHSKNIETIKGAAFDTLVCSATPATKWLANKEPEQDWQSIQRLMEALATVKAKQFFLISTVDVFQQPVGVDENSLVPTDGLQPYGAHRYAFEQFVRVRFPAATILRLPALFGPGLKKNALYDLIHSHEVEKVPRDGIFQWYNVRRLPADMQRAAGLPLVHLVTEPLALSSIIDELFPHQKGCGKPGTAARYDLHTIHAARFGGSGSYVASADSVLQELAAYVAEEKTRLAQSQPIPQTVGV